MYIQIRTADGSRCKRVEVSRVTPVATLKDLIKDEFQVEVDKQLLFFGGKQLVDNHTIFDYHIKLNDVVLLMIKADHLKENNVPPASKEQTILTEGTEDSTKKLVCQQSALKVGDYVDALWDHYGAWFEGSIVQVKGNQSIAQSLSEKSVKDLSHEILQYAIQFNHLPDDPPSWVSAKSVRALMNKRVPLSEIKVNDYVLVNYNILNPNERGYWYELQVTLVNPINTLLKGDLYVGREGLKLDNCSIRFTSEVYDTRSFTSDIKGPLNDIVDRTKSSAENCGPKCHICKDDPKSRCKSCACHVCGGKLNAHLQIICDECDQPYHIGCLKPPLDSIPEVEYWYCPKCKNDSSEIVRAGEGLKESKLKKKKQSSKVEKSKRDWGKGMACVGRTKQCTIVPHNHFGPVPGVEVGSCWKFRVSAAEAGVHRPQVAGIHGRENEGAFSLVLSGGYEDDKDDGEEFYYTGSGGRDLSGNKRTAKQSCDQTLTKMNLALAVNCKAPINKTEGAEAANWKEGKPVRVVRNYKAAKHSEYAPEEGNRYDGIYKVVKYFPQKGESGFVVWRYLLRRDDPSPAPWTKEGQQRIKELGLRMIFPVGYEEVIEEKCKVSSSQSVDVSDIESTDINEEPASKRRKLTPYILSQDLCQKIEHDNLNVKLWAACKKKFHDGKSALLEEIQKQFMCIICQDLVVLPVTTTCGHNVCELCLRRSFAAKVYTCPCCRYDLGKSYDIKVNDNLKLVLQSLFPGYETGR